MLYRDQLRQPPYAPRPRSLSLSSVDLDHDIRALVCSTAPSTTHVHTPCAVNRLYSFTSLSPFVCPSLVQVLDYPTQQRMLIPLLALAYALHFSGQHMRSAYHYYLDTQDASALPDLHATSAGLKALVTQV